MSFYSVERQNYIERDLEKTINPFLEDREIIAIRGPRQSGKTTLMGKIADFLAIKHRPDSVIFKTFEDELEKSKFTTNPRQYLEFYLRGKKDKLYMLFDEVQYVENAGKIFKLLFDVYPQIKFIISGSSTLDVVALGRYLVGRILYFELYPFSFGEFLKAKDYQTYLEYKAQKFNWNKPKLADSLYKERLNKYLLEYLTYGSYPRVVLEKKIEKKRILLKNIVTTYLEKDIVRLYGLKYKDPALKILKYLASTLGSLTNYNDICQTTALHYAKLKEILSILEDTYVIAKINPFHKNLITELRKNPKYYFLDLGLRNTLIEHYDFSPDEEGKLLENYAYLTIKNKQPSFWRTTAKAEVDFILKKPFVPLEVKKTAKITRSLLSFVKHYQPSFCLIADWKGSEKRRKSKKDIYIIPLCLL